MCLCNDNEKIRNPFGVKVWHLRTSPLTGIMSTLKVLQDNHCLIWFPQLPSNRWCWCQRRQMRERRQETKKSLSVFAGTVLFPPLCFSLLPDRAGCQQWCQHFEKSHWNQRQRENMLARKRSHFQGPKTEGLLSVWKAFPVSFHRRVVPCSCKVSSQTGPCPLPSWAQLLRNWHRWESKHLKHKLQ